MPQPPDWNKYLDAGAEFVAMTRTQARQAGQGARRPGPARPGAGRRASSTTWWTRAGSAPTCCSTSSARRSSVRSRRSASRRRTTWPGSSRSWPSRRKAAKSAKPQATKAGAAQEVAAKKSAKAAKSPSEVREATKAAEAGEEVGQESGREGRRFLAAPGGIVRRRLDVELVRRGLVSSRTRAAEAVEAGPGHGRRCADALGRPSGRASTSRSCSRAIRRGSSPAAARSSTPRSSGSRSMSRGAPGARRRRFDRWVHGLPAPARRGHGRGGRRRARRSWTGRSARMPG